MTGDATGGKAKINYQKIGNHAERYARCNSFIRRNRDNRSREYRGHDIKLQGFNQPCSYKKSYRNKMYKIILHNAESKSPR